VAHLLGSIPDELAAFRRADDSPFLYCDSIRRQLTGETPAADHDPQSAPFWKDTFAALLAGGEQRRERCPQCHQRDKTRLLRSAQLRSADEGQTLTFGCDGCGAQWTVNT